MTWLKTETTALHKLNDRILVTESGLLLNLQYIFTSHGKGDHPDYLSHAGSSTTWAELLLFRKWLNRAGYGWIWLIKDRWPRIRQAVPFTLWKKFKILSLNSTARSVVLITLDIVMGPESERRWVSFSKTREPPLNTWPGDGWWPPLWNTSLCLKTEQQQIRTK